MPTSSSPSFAESTSLPSPPTCAAVLVIFFAPVGAPVPCARPDAAEAPPNDLLTERALQRVVLRHGLVITESGAGGAPYYQRVLRCLAETEEQAEDLLATLDMVGNLLRLTPYYEGVACHPLLPNLIIMESAVTHERPPATCGSILDFAEPEDFLHTSLITDVDPARRDRAVRRLQAILNRKPVDGRRAGDPSAAAAYDRS